jgi:transcriptional regulator with XRE-family HTH domain
MASGARLSTAAAEGIRERYAAGGVTQASLAALHGVSQSTISAALSGRTWNPA